MTTSEENNTAQSGLNERLAAAIDSIAPSLVAVHGSRTRQTASGIVWGPDGLVVTTHSGTWDDEGIQVTLASGDRHPALVLGRDPTTDLLVLQVSGLEGSDTALPVPARVGLDELGPGKLAIAVGRLAKGTRASWGPISELSGEWTSPLGGRVDGRVVVDAGLPRGLSGSALIDIEGRLVGMNTRRLDRGGTTLPASTIDRVVAQVQEGGSLRPGWLGVAVLPVALPTTQADALGQHHGLILLGVEQDGPGDGVLLQGDVLVALDGSPLASPRDLKAALGPDAVGRVLTVKLVRAGELLELELTPAERPEGAGRERRGGPPWGHHHGHHGHHGQGHHRRRHHRRRHHGHHGQHGHRGRRGRC